MTGEEIRHMAEVALVRARVARLEVALGLALVLLDQDVRLSPIERGLMVEKLSESLS